MSPKATRVRSRAIALPCGQNVSCCREKASRLDPLPNVAEVLVSLQKVPLGLQSLEGLTRQEALCRRFGPRRPRGARQRRAGPEVSAASKASSVASRETDATLQSDDVVDLAGRDARDQDLILGRSSPIGRSFTDAV